MTLRINNKEESVTCTLCPHMCRLSPYEEGKCRARVNSGGTVLPTTYGRISSFGIDPIEKKPLYHFYPGSHIFSIGSWGCNFSCSFCQNHRISQSGVPPGADTVTPGEIVEEAAGTPRNIGIAYTYNEPSIGFEFMKDTATAAAERGLKNVAVSNGYINQGPLRSLTGLIDAWNIDLKSFSDNFYRTYTGGTLAPVLKSISIIAESGRHLEITTLIIPGLNDSRQEMSELAEWISKTAGRATPLHLSRYFPMYRSTIPPTSGSKIAELVKVAKEWLDYVYAGNIEVEGGGETTCPSCGTIVTERHGYKTNHPAVGQDGHCSNCNYLIYRYI